MRYSLILTVLLIFPIFIFAQSSYKMDSLNGEKVYREYEVDSQPRYGKSRADFLQLLISYASKAAIGTTLYQRPTSLYKFCY